MCYGLNAIIKRRHQSITCDMYCCLKADLIASNLLEPGPAEAALLAAKPPVTNPGLNVGRE